MRQLSAIARNTFLQTVRQPIYGIVVLITLGGFCLAPSVTGWTLDDDNKMLRDLGLSTLLIQGLFLACLTASGVIDAEIEDKTALTVVAKPVNRAIFVLGKYLGVMASLLIAFYLSSIAFYMMMRHGVLQTSAEEVDMSVVLLGPALMLVVAIAAGIINYTTDRRFLPTLVGLSLPVFTVATGILLVVDRHGKLQHYEATQTIASLPPQVAGKPEIFRGIVQFRPDPGSSDLPGHPGILIRQTWQGPISEPDKNYLMSLVDTVQWRRDIGYLYKTARDLQGIEIAKASLLVLGAIAILGAIAVASSTRVGLFGTFLITFGAMCGGLSVDQMVKPLADAGSTWASVLYRIIPSFQGFWMIDALSDDRIIPLSYMGSALSYALILIAAFLLLGIGLFETREVG